MTQSPPRPPAETKSSSPGGTPAAAAPRESLAEEKPRTPFRKTLLRFLLIGLGVLLLAFFAYRWAGTSTLRGYVQRVYEKDAAYRVEFIEESGEVWVIENTPIRFPHFKLDTSDLHAKLHHLSQTGDIVDLSAWGIRLSWLEIYPNAIEVEFVRSNADKKKARAAAITTSVMNELMDQGIVARGLEAEKVRPGVEAAILQGLDVSSNAAAPETPPPQAP